MIAPLLIALAASAAAPPAFRSLEPGLEVAEVLLPVRSDVGDSTVTVLRIDPARFELSILSSEALGLDRKPASGWIRDQGLVVVTNAGMFEPNGAPTGHARTGNLVLKEAWKPQYQAVLAFGPRRAGLPAVQILDSACDDLKAAAKDYTHVVQSIRMIDCKRRNAWAARKQRYSSVIAAIDSRGRLLLLHCRSPYVMRDYIAQLLELPLDLQRATYLEGGPEASLRVRAHDEQWARVGSYETSFYERDDNHEEWALPNVIAVKRRQR